MALTYSPHFWAQLHVFLGLAAPQRTLLGWSNALTNLKPRAGLSPRMQPLMSLSLSCVREHSFLLVEPRVDVLDPYSSRPPATRPSYPGCGPLCQNTRPGVNPRSIHAMADVNVPAEPTLKDACGTPLAPSKRTKALTMAGSNHLHVYHNGFAPEVTVW